MRIYTTATTTNSSSSGGGVLPATSSTTASAGEEGQWRQTAEEAQQPEETTNHDLLATESTEEEKEEKSEKSSTSTSQSEPEQSTTASGMQSEHPTCITDIDLAKLVLEDLFGNTANATTKTNALKQLADVCVVESPSSSSSPSTPKEEIFGSGVLTGAILAMKQFPNQERLQHQGCRCVHNIICGWPFATRSFVQLGGIEILMAAMKSFPKSPQVLTCAMAALSSCFGFDEDENKYNEKSKSKQVASRFVDALDGLTITVTAMKAFPEEPSLQYHGLLLFHNLCQVDTVYKLCVRMSGAISAIGMAMENNSNNPQIQKNGAIFLKFLLT